MIFMLSHSHGANMTTHATPKTKRLGKTKAKALRAFPLVRIAQNRPEQERQRHDRENPEIREPIPEELMVLLHPARLEMDDAGGALAALEEAGDEGDANRGRQDGPEDEIEHLHAAAGERPRGPG